MQKILTKKTVSLTDLRDPKKVLEFAGDEPVAVMNRNKVVGYFIPVSAIPDADHLPEVEIDLITTSLRE